jgi:hypothetical protein
MTLLLIYNLQIANAQNKAVFRGHPLRWMSFLKDEFYSENYEGNILFEGNKGDEVFGVKSFEDYNWIEWKKIK